MPTWLEEVAEQRENTRCVVCGDEDCYLWNPNPDFEEGAMFCEEHFRQVGFRELRRETGQDAEGNLVVRWRRWEQVWVPGELLPLPKS